MPFAELSAVKHRLQLGAPLPFNVRNADKTLILARGQRIDTAEQLAALLERGALVDLSELLTPADRLKGVPREQLPGLWTEAISQVAEALTRMPEPGSIDTLMAASGPMQALIEHDPDLAIFQVLQQGANADIAYGVQRSTQTAIATVLVAHRLAWEDAHIERAFKVALTMNISMLELQGVLAAQKEAPTPAQRELIQSHPERSARMLVHAGVTSKPWIDAVLSHHEVEDGSGYPQGSRALSDLAALVRRTDVYTAKLARRATRPAMAPDKASRQMFMQDAGHSMTAAIVKEFGLCPPGSPVQLANGEVGLVIERGKTITSPIVAVFADDRGKPLPRLMRRDTSVKAMAVSCMLELGNLRGAPSLHQILAALR